MKRAIAIGFLTWAAFAAIYDFVLRGHMSYALPAAIGAGLFMAVVAGTVRISIDDLLSARRLSIDTEPRDGETVAATGPIRVDGEPLRAPFSRRPAAIYIYEIDRDVRGSSVKDYSGFALAPSTVEAFHGPVRLAGFPRLENFEKTIAAGARPDVAAATFERGRPDEAATALRRKAKQQFITATVIAAGVNLFVSLPFFLRAPARPAHSTSFDAMYQYHDAVRRGDLAAAQRIDG